MPSEARESVLALPEGWNVWQALSCRNGVSVHRATAPDGRIAVLKRLDLETPDPIARRRFEREQRFARILNHPGLPAWLGMGEGWLALEVLATSLDERRNAFGRVEDVVALLRTMGRTLAYLHGRGIVHQDLKPAHVLFRATGRVVLIDLGSAGLIAGDPLAGREAIGSPAWAAPEQWAGAAPAPAADLWSLGCIGLWLTGREDPDDVASPLGPLLQQCLSAVPGQRPSAAGFVEALEPPRAEAASGALRQSKRSGP
ncbi:protein kinase domain-containing protein [Aureimonas pseudogalii]|uniref:Serine/threonine-protein kinase n=1 Tax=Aureimonas pseudogalii TaxID=1744844 RepID=A0A7W6H8G4_9HYPH|nr:protein kinase [Aureimonas pseudogalii]MBB4000442.1 serine/threonine-protein kinase [Aureimonas pseudogalii]